MANRDPRRSPRWILVVATIVAISAGWLLVRPAEAGPLDRLETSLQLIPHDAAFYSAMLRNREQIEAITGSRAWAKLLASPYARLGLSIYREQSADPESPAGKFKAALEDPQVRQLLDLACDMLSDEIFFYGDEGIVDALELVQEVYAAARYGPVVLRLTGEDEGVDQDRLRGMLVLSALCENLDLAKVPNVVVGFKLSDTDRAAGQLGKLEALVHAVLEDEEDLEPLRGRFQRTQVAGHEYLTLSLDGEMIPWDKLPLDETKELETEQGDVDKLVAHVKKSKLVIALGIRDDYLLLSIGPSTDGLARLGKGKRLIDRPELKPLEKFADQRLAEVSYVSKSMMARVATGKQDIDGLLQVVEEVLPAAELKPQQKAKIRRDAAALAEDLKGMIPQPGPLMAFSFLTDQGIEGYQYDWSDHSWMDGSKPLGLLQHVGGNPLLAVVSRGKHSPEDYELLVKWLRVAYGYFEEYAVPEMDEEDRRQYRKLVELAGPLVARADQVNREMLMPALADGQAGLVIDAQLRSSRFIRALPATDQPMPMIEPALVIGVSDAELLRKAIGEYRKLLDGLVDAVRRIEPDSIPAEYSIPDPEVTRTEAGKIYGYRLPEDWGVDEQIVPNFGLSETVAVLSLTREHSQRLLRPTPLEVGGVLGKPDRPLAAAATFHFAALVDAATPWVDLAVEKIAEILSEDEDLGPAFDKEAVTAQLQALLEVLKVLRTVTSESYFEDDALVSHTLMELRDIEE